MIAPDALDALCSEACVDLLAALDGVSQEPTAAAIERLRRSWPAPIVAAAVEVQWARTRAATKFGAGARELWLDRAGAEMASSPRAAAWKARRFAAGTRLPVLDACCGIGGDLMQLAGACSATGIDADPGRAWMAARNARVQVACGDAIAFGASIGRGKGMLVHADPGRRSGGQAGARRFLDTADLQPPLSDLRHAFSAAIGMGIKLGPGMDLGEQERTAADELEFIAESGTLTQQVLWTGALAVNPGCNTASHVCTGATLTGAPEPTPCRHDGVWRDMIAVPDPAIERARLVHLVAHGAQEPSIGVGILTDTDIAPSQWLEVHRVIAQMPAREKTVLEWLRAHGGGVPTVRTRGKACDTDAWQRALRSTGDARHTVWVLRTGQSKHALITEPVPDS